MKILWLEIGRCGWSDVCTHTHTRVCTPYVDGRSTSVCVVRELLNPFLASANTRSCLWSPYTTPEQALFFRLGTLHLKGQNTAFARAYPAVIGHIYGGTRRHAHITCRSCPWVNDPPMAHRSLTMGRMRRNAAAVVVRRHPIYSTFFLSWQVFAALFLKIFLLMWENANKYRYF